MRPHRIVSDVVDDRKRRVECACGAVSIIDVRPGIDPKALDAWWLIGRAHKAILERERA